MEFRQCAMIISGFKTVGGKQTNFGNVGAAPFRAVRHIVHIEDSSALETMGKINFFPRRASGRQERKNV